MPIEPWTRDRRRDRTRQVLMDAAAEAFARRGFHGASLDEIAEAAGYTRGAITFNFGAKEDLFLAVVERHNTALLDRYAALLQDANESHDIESISEAWRELEASDTDTLCLVLELRLYGLRNPKAAEKMAAFERRTEETIARFIEEQAKAAGAELAVSAEDLAAILYSATYGLQQHVALCPKDHKDLFQRLLELILGQADAGAPPRPRSAPHRTRSRRQGPMKSEAPNEGRR